MTATQDAPVDYEPDSGPWEMLSAMLPTADWTFEAAAGQLALAVDRLRGEEVPPEFDGKEDASAVVPDIYERITRALYRRNQRHVLLTGLNGVGKTATIRELARRAAAGAIPFLNDRRFLWIDAANVGPEDSRACLETIAAAAANPPAVAQPIFEDEDFDGDFGQAFGRIVSKALERALEEANDESEPPNVILCLDGFDALLKRPHGGTNKPLIRALASRPGLQIIGILNRWAFNDLIAGDAQMLELFTRIDIEEPSEEFAVEVLRQKAAEYEEDYGLKIPNDVIQRTIALTSNFLLNECHPAKGIKVLRQACDEADYESTQLGTKHETIETADVVRVVSELTGIPAATLEGETGEIVFETALTEAVVGQDLAVKAAATELRLIKSGLTEPGKPAGVLLFAGMTGVGKTELAKRIAELYSTSKRLQTYSMGNFTEPHSVSGIIGVPPGYVGHEEGGRLINELNSDPYSVFLLDEAEKCHPNVWKPFLNLFDEGWIVDQRGVKAYADRAIFILTTNAGDKTIAQMSRQGKPEEEIIERVKNTLSRVRHERSSQPVFTPQFLSRLKRIVVFGPLDEAAMIGIARKIIGQVAGLWRQKRDKEFAVSEEAIEYIGKQAFERNEGSNGEEGGRIVRKLVSDEIEHRVQLEATERRDDYKACRVIRIELDAADSEDGEDPVVKIFFSA